MTINDVQFNAELIDILSELISQLRANGIDLISKMKEGPTHIQICCPYHNNGMERRPSAGIRKEDGIFHCFACGEVHSLQEVISYCFGYTDDVVGKFGWQWLLKNFATIKTEERKDVELDFKRADRNSSMVRNFCSGDTVDSGSNDNFRQNVSESELEKYRYIHPYLYKRGLTDEIIQLFDIGFDRDSDCITFPVRDISGRCLFIARRSVRTKYFSYPKGVEKPLYGLYELSRLEKFPAEIYICESMLDALTIWCYNKYAVALNGLGNELSIAQIRKLPCRKVILATDKDDAGKKARIRLRKELNNKIVTELDYRTYPDHAKDMNDMTEEEFYALGEVF